MVGLDANPSTAWFAVFEVGIPAALLGGVLGRVSAAIARVVRRGGRRRASSLRALEQRRQLERLLRAQGVSGARALT